jgi:5-oxoprolinase (ATP-hydrolysing) subunit A
MLKGGAGAGSIAEPRIDLNCDMGEGMETDAAIFPFISSANIACGAHAGDADTMRRTVELALRHGVAIGAHPSYPDKAGFGRVDILGKPLRPEDLPVLLHEQLHRLQSICREFGVRLRHVKPHGALYNRAARDASVAALITRAVLNFDPALLLYGLSGSEMRVLAEQEGLEFVSEVFADRTYQPDGSLTPRSQPGALIEAPDRAVAQVLKMVREGLVDTPGGEVAIAAETVCLHGDGDHAVAFAQLIHGVLRAEGVRVVSPVIDRDGHSRLASVLM